MGVPHPLYRHVLHCGAGTAPSIDDGAGLRTGRRPRPKPLEELAALDAIGGADGPAACSVGIIGGSDGPTAILMARPRAGLGADPPQLRTACSALRFQPQARIAWRMVFHQKTVDGVSLELLP